MRSELLGGAGTQAQAQALADESDAASMRPPSYTTVDNSGDSARNELFSGAPPRSAQGNYGGGINQSAYEGLEEEQSGGVANEDEDVEAIKQQTRYVKEDSRESTRNALRIARETEENATNTVMKLGDQSGGSLHLLNRTALKLISLKNASLTLNVISISPKRMLIVQKIRRRNSRN